MSFQLGDVVPLSVTVTDAGGNPANAGSVTLTVTLPDGTTDVTSGIAPTATGIYDHDFVTTQAGRHGVRWIATGVNESAYTDVFDAAAADGGTFVSLADAKAHLNKTDTKDDAELAAFILAACQMITDRIGQVAPVTITDDVHLHRPSKTITLGSHPVVSVTSVQVIGSDLIPAADLPNHVDGWELNPGAGVMTHTRWFPYGTIRVSYRAGMTPLPGNVRLAALELVSHLWRSSQLNSNGNRPGLSGQDDLAMRSVSYALPFRVRELLGLGKLPNDDVLVG